MIVAATARGKLYGIDSISGKIQWQVRNVGRKLFGQIVGR
jgi:hypothetical protein